jgi:hypothetical protein
VILARQEVRDSDSIRFNNGLATTDGDVEHIIDESAIPFGGCSDEGITKRPSRTFRLPPLSPDRDQGAAGAREETAPLAMNWQPRTSHDHPERLQKLSLPIATDRNDRSRLTFH